MDSGSRIAHRERAIRVLAGQMERSDLVRSIYPRLDHHALRERALRVVVEHDGIDAAPWIREIAEDGTQHAGVRERAIRLLGELRETEHLRGLYARLDQTTLRERTIRVVAEVERAEAAAWLRGIAEDRAEATAIRERAIRVLGEMRQVSYLQQVYPILDNQGLRERVLRIVGERATADAVSWIEGVALDSSERQAIRERAVRVLAERRVETTRLVDLYDRVDSRQVRERLIRIFADRRDSASVEKLQSIMDEDPSSDLRRSAARRLGGR